MYTQVTGVMSLKIDRCRKSPNIGTSGLRASPGHYQVGGPTGIYWPTTLQRKFNGDISGLATYEYVLTPTEIEAHYVAGVP